MGKESTIYELLKNIPQIIEILDNSQKLFIASRFAESPQKRKYYDALYEENLQKSDLILQDAYDNHWMSFILEFVQGLARKTDQKEIQNAR